jgi:hypothetical protein
MSFLRSFLVFLTNHNILFVKLFQVLSTNELLSPGFLSYFKECTNNYSCYSSDVDHELLDEILKTHQLALCSSRPINAGMIALVYTPFHISNAYKPPSVASRERSSLNEGSAYFDVNWQLLLCNR